MIIDYDLTVKTEYHIGTGLEHPGVVDRTLVTKADGTLVIPSEHFRGLVRDSCTQIIHWLKRDDECCKASLTKGPRQADVGVLDTCGLNFNPPGKANFCVLCRLFGTTFTPRHYEFFDSTLTTSLTDENARRVSMHNRIDPAIGRTPEENYFSLQVGAKATFQGTIERDSPQTDSDLLIDELGLLLAGLRLVERVGGRSRKGWGRCRVNITKLKLDNNENLPGSMPSATVDACLRAYISKEGEK
jgi:CRISPR/Cas system CSM-associated protein Csm3 (group 7 of RAMP superfamily)